MNRLFNRLSKLLRYARKNDGRLSVKALPKKWNEFVRDAVDQFDEWIDRVESESIQLSDDDIDTWQLILSIARLVLAGDRAGALAELQVLQGVLGEER